MTDAATLGTSRSIQAPDGRRYAFADHHCFACGATNPAGMHLVIEFGDASARTEWVAGEDFVGWSDKVHGGIVATLLDEVMAWAPSSFDSWAVTAEMTVRFRSPASPGERLIAEGRVVERRRRIYTVRGEVKTSDGRLVAEGSGRYLGASPTQKAALKKRYGIDSPDSDAAGQTPGTRGE
ncbi:MAG: PaaI family thioesterase [Chloroflexota bacterium]